MLWSCPETFSLIQQLNQWSSTTNTYTNNIEELFIFNIGQNIEANQHIILVTKYYIYLTKRLNKPFSLIALKHRLKRYYLTLKSIAVKNKKLDIFEKKKSGILIKTYLKILKFKY